MIERKAFDDYVKNSKNSEYCEKVIKELKERCQARDEVFEYDVKHTRKSSSAALEFVRMQQ